MRADSLIRLFFKQPLEKGKEYQIQVAGIPDLEGNFLQDTLVNFQFFDPTDIPQKGLVINEIMPAPRADLDLPNVEYVELFMRENMIFEWKTSNGPIQDQKLL